MRNISFVIRVTRPRSRPRRARETRSLSPSASRAKSPPAGCPEGRHPSNLRVAGPPGPRAHRLTKLTPTRHIFCFHPRERHTFGGERERERETVPIRRRFKQRKGRPPFLARLFSGNAIPYASVTLPADAPSARCRRRLTLSLSFSHSPSHSLFLSLPLRVPSYFSSSSQPSPFSILFLSPLGAPLLHDSPLCRYFPID